MKSIDELRGFLGKSPSVVYPDEVFGYVDAIEREVGERYVEGPTDKNGNPINYGTMIHQWGALEYIACEMHPDGTHEWFVRGHDISAPLLKANDVEVCKTPTVEDMLEEYRIKYYNLVTDMGITSEEYVQGIKELTSEFAAKLQIRED